MSIKQLIFPFLFLLNFTPCHLFAQEVQFISETKDPYFGSLKTFNIAEKKLNKIREHNLLKIFPADLYKNKAEDLPPVMGKWIFENNDVYFIPRFPFKPNKEYVVELNLEKKYVYRVLIPEINFRQPTYVEKIFPSTNIWPANQLKIYIHFSSPMGLGDIYEHIKLFDRKGNEVEKPFLEINPPLWDKTQQRLTLWFDPGRIKRHLSPNENLGPPLEENDQYTVFISKNAQDASGRQLLGNFEEFFYTGSNDRKKPDPAEWTFSFPIEKDKKEVVIKFPESMDRGMLESGIGIIDETGVLVNGKIEISDSEKNWIFYPEKKWQSGKYKIMISNKIEDLAGNNLKRLFDQNVEDKENKKKEIPDLEIPFSIK